MFGMTIFRNITSNVPSFSNNRLCVIFPIKLLRNLMEVVASSLCIARGVALINTFWTRYEILGRNGKRDFSFLFNNWLRIWIRATRMSSTGPGVRYEWEIRIVRKRKSQRSDSVILMRTSVPRMKLISSENLTWGGDVFVFVIKQWIIFVFQQVCNSLHPHIHERLEIIG